MSTDYPTVIVEGQVIPPQGATAADLKRLGILLAQWSATKISTIQAGGALFFSYR
jgi:hypothetical protein